MNEALGLMQDSAITGQMNDIGGHMGNYSWHMMDSPYMWLWMIVGWLVLVVIAFLVYRDADSKGMNGLLWFVLVILPCIGFIFLVIYLVIRNNAYNAVSPKSASAILNERYARGEITQEEYEEMKVNLKGGV